MVKNLLKRLGYFLAVFFVSSLLYTLYLRWLRPVTTPTMVAKALQGEKNFQCYWRGLDEISEDAALAVIAAEDQNFAWHHGFDFAAIKKAMQHNNRSKHIRGASTISQQVAKNVFLWSGRSYLRKGLEVYFTALIEVLWPKKRILEMYLNVAQTGDEVFGVEAAARKYYHTTAARLNASQAAMIAAVLPNPVRFSVSQPSARIRRKQGRILVFMNHLGRDYIQQLKKGGKPAKPGEEDEDEDEED